MKKFMFASGVSALAIFINHEASASSMILMVNSII